MESPQSIIKRSRRNNEPTTATTTRRVSFSPSCAPKQRGTNSLLTPTTTPQPHAATGVQKIIFTPHTDRTPKPVKAMMSTFHEGLHTQTNLDSATKKTHEVVMKTMIKNLKGGWNGPRCDGEALVKMIAPPTITVICTDRIKK